MRSIILLLILLFGLTSSAQTLKLYSGEYDAPHNDPLIRFGNATYTYYQNDDKRIYHGRFYYKDKKNFITGNFVNNVQDGSWTYQTTNLNGICEYSLKFKNGVLNGPFSMTLTNPRTNRIIKKVSCNFINGKLRGNAAGTNVTLAITGDLSTIKTNSFNGKFDEEGFPEGLWTLNGNSRQWEEYYCENDTCKVTYINLSTGDKINPSYEYEFTPRLPNLIIKEVNSLLKTILMRDSSQNLFIEFKFDTPRIVREYTEGNFSCSITTDDPLSCIFIITYPHHYSDILPNESGNKMPVFQEIPNGALKPPKQYKPSSEH